MPHLHEIGRRFYVQFLRLNRDAPLWEFAPTRETDDPYRYGRGIILRLWPSTRAVVVGRWVGRIDDPSLAELIALQQVMETPRRTDDPYWCRGCGRTLQCDCPPDDDGTCPVCELSWAECQCLVKAESSYYERKAGL